MHTCRVWRASWLAAVLLAGSVSCERVETKYDVYLKGAQIEGEARRGDCRLMYDEGAQSNVISGDQIQTCLLRIEEALGHYERALALDPADLQFQQAVANAKHQKQRLDGMLTMVRKMERSRVGAK